MNKLWMSVLTVLAVLVLVPAAAQACGGANCMFLSPRYAVCSGGSPTDGDWCLVVCENGLCTCDDIACDDGGGGGRVPTRVQEVGAVGGGVVGRAWGQDKLAKFRGLTQAQAATLCAVTPGCTMAVGDEVLVRTAPTWGRLKVMYR